MKDSAIEDIIFLKKNPWQSVEFHLINCANRLKGQICKKPPFSEVYGIFLATLNIQSLYSLPYEEEEEDTFIYQLWAHEGHEYSHI